MKQLEIEFFLKRIDQMSRLEEQIGKRCDELEGFMIRNKDCRYLKARFGVLVDLATEMQKRFKELSK